MNKIIESGYNVAFGSSLRVIKIDAHRYYSYVSGRGFKSVDFIAIDKDIGLILIELKNYVDHNNQPDVKAVADVFYQKCEDTLRLLEIINVYYRKKWWIRFLVFRCGFTFLLTKDDWIWIDAYRHYREGNVVLLGDFNGNFDF